MHDRVKEPTPMFTKLAIFSIALIAAAPVVAANSAGTSASAVSSASGGHAGGSGGGGGGGAAHGGTGFGAHSAAMSTHLGGAGHPLHAAATAHSAPRAGESRHMAMNEASKKPGHGHDHASHLFLHRGTNEFQGQWASTCIRTFTPPDGAWADCNRPVKTNPGSRT
jgi:hypothetical protein